MKYNFTITSFLLILAFFLPLYGAEIKLEDIAAKLAPMSKTQNVQADFTQKRHFAQMDFTMTVTGKFVQADDGRIAWISITPIQSKCIITQEGITLKNADTKKPISVSATKMPFIKTLLDMQNKWSNGDVLGLQNDFSITVLEEHSLSLVPKAKELAAIYPQIDIFFNTNFTFLDKIIFTEATKDTMEIIFTNVSLGAPISQETWQF